MVNTPSPLVVDGVDYNLKPARKDRPQWEVKINGRIVENVATLTAIFPTMGIGFGYGESPNGGYNQGLMVNRGGAVIVLTHDDYMIVLEQVRILVGPDAIDEFPRGQAKLDERGIETALRELMEELGLNIPTDSFTYLGAYNPDTALVYGANVHYWWAEVPSEFIDTTGEVHTLRPEIRANPENKLAERILGAHFVRDTELYSPSMMTMMGLGLVLQWKRRAKRARAMHSSSGETVAHGDDDY